MPDEEGMALHDAAIEAAAKVGAPLVEIGAYCGKSTVYLGAAARRSGVVLFSVDHHRGSEENQAGWPHHDPRLVDPRTGRMDTLPRWRDTIEAAGLEYDVVGVVGDSPTVARSWRAPLSMVFIDGGHGELPAWTDYRAWAPLVGEGGTLAIHDVFLDESLGGTPPRDIWLAALSGGQFHEIGHCGSLRLLRRQSFG